MTERWHKITNLALLMLVTLIALNIQTVLWFHTLGDYTAPSLWLLTLTYLTLRRPWTETMGGIYVLGFIVASHSLANWGWVVLISFAVYLSLDMIRRRVYLESTTYFSAMGFASVLLFNLYHLFLVGFYDTNPMERPDIIRWIAQGLTTGGLAPLFFVIFEKIDEYTRRGLMNGTLEGDSL